MDRHQRRRHGAYVVLQHALHCPVRIFPDSQVGGWIERNIHRTDFKMLQATGGHGFECAVIGKPDRRDADGIEDDLVAVDLDSLLDRVAGAVVFPGDENDSAIGEA